MINKFQLHQTPEGIYSIRSIEAEECYSYFEYKTVYNNPATANTAFSWLTEFYKNDSAYKYSHHWILRTKEFPLMLNNDECTSKSLSVADAETTMNSTLEQ